jgi:hypothetical protein
MCHSHRQTCVCEQDSSLHRPGNFCGNCCSYLCLVLAHDGFELCVVELIVKRVSFISMTAAGNNKENGDSNETTTRGCMEHSTTYSTLYVHFEREDWPSTATRAAPGQKAFTFSADLVECMPLWIWRTYVDAG